VTCALHGQKCHLSRTARSKSAMSRAPHGQKAVLGQVLHEVFVDEMAGMRAVLGSAPFRSQSTYYQGSQIIRDSAQASLPFPRGAVALVVALPRPPKGNNAA
jgi:hypothetical protein